MAALAPTRRRASLRWTRRQAGGDSRFGRQDPRWPDAVPPAHEDYYQADQYQPEYRGWTGQPAPEADYPGRTQQPAYRDDYLDPVMDSAARPPAGVPRLGRSARPPGRLPRLDAAAHPPGRLPRLDRTARAPGRVPRLDRTARVPGRVPRLDRTAPARVPGAVWPVRPPSRSPQLARISVLALARRGPGDRPAGVGGGGRAAAAGTGAAALHPPARLPCPRRRPSPRARPAQGYPAAPGHGFLFGADHAGHHHGHRQLGAARTSGTRSPPASRSGTQGRRSWPTGSSKTPISKRPRSLARRAIRRPTRWQTRRRRRPSLSGGPASRPR